VKPLTVPVYVPKAGTETARLVADGSGVVGSPGREGLVTIDYEGAVYGQESLARYAVRVLHAADRHATRYPTLARMVVPEEELVLVGWWIIPDRRVALADEAARDLVATWIEWSGAEPLERELRA